MKLKKLIVISVIIITVIIIGFFTSEKHQGYSVMTNISIPNKTLDFKTLKKDTFKRLNIEIVKNQKEPLLIYSVEKSSSSINIDQSPQYYKKDTIIIPLTYFSNTKTGSIKESITLKGNFPEKEITIELIGNVENESSK